MIYLPVYMNMSCYSICAMTIFGFSPCQLLCGTQAIENYTFVAADGVLMPLEEGTSAFITMNPGYIGRAELPESLKVRETETEHTKFSLFPELPCRP